MTPWIPERISQCLPLCPGAAPVYLVGAGGCGMSGLGHLLIDLGFSVAGSDLVMNPEVRQLQQRGAEIATGHTPELIRRRRPFLVVHSAAVGPGNPELREAQALGVPVIPRAVLLAALVQRQRGICVAGMHGKTTTSALLAFALNQLQAHPSYAIGALVPQLTPHAHFHASPPSDPLPWFVAEVDESDGSLSLFRPEYAIVLNVDEEHLDHYANLDHICRIFETYARQTAQTVVYCADNPHLCRFLPALPRVLSYGFSPKAHYRIDKDPVPGCWRFHLIHQGTDLGEFGLRLVGDQNLSNAAAVIALLHHLGYAPGRVAEAVGAFQGAARRQERLFHDDRFQVFDDYGHHPCEIAATVQALKTLGGRRLLVAFQPHRFTRTKHLIKQFATCFKGVDRLWITEIYAASEAAIPGTDGGVLAAVVRQQGQEATFVSSLDDLGAAVRAAMEPGDVVLFLGAGDITRVAHEMAARLAREQASGDPPIERANPVQDQAGALDPLTQLAGRLSQETVWRRHESLARHTTLRVGGPADLYLEPATETELSQVLARCHNDGLPVLLLGRGSNLLVRDRGFRGVVICLAQPTFTQVKVVGQRLHCGAGARLKRVVSEAKRHSLGGLEFLEGIPGSLGGALRMNAGAMGGHIFGLVESLRVMDMAGRAEEWPAARCEVGYRECRTLRDYVVLSAVLQGETTDQATITQNLAAFSEKRWSSQPAAPSAGCIFKNPKSIPAGQLVDELGFKGTRVGGALVSDVHANFIINTGSATAQDILTLIGKIQERARSERGIELETELVIAGE